MSIISDAIALATKAKQIADQLANLDLKEAIAELREKLLEAKEENLTLREENTTLKAEKAKLSLPPAVIKKEGKYYSEKGDGPFCPRCYEVDQRLITLTHLRGSMMIAKFHCPQCDKGFS